MKVNQKDLEALVKKLLKALGEDVNRPGLKDTPGRVARAWKEWTRANTPFPNTLRLFPAKFSGLIVRSGIPFSSTCEHHLAPYSGTIDFGYVPDEKVTGISKIIRFLHHFTAKLSIQEELTRELVERFEEIVKPKGTIIKITAHHTCESTRGVKVPGVPTITFLETGVFKKNKRLVVQFHRLIK